MKNQKKNVIPRVVMAASMMTVGSGLFNCFEAQASPYGCDGGTTYACGFYDVLEVYEDLANNCCAGSYLSVTDVCEGGTYDFYSDYDGVNATCN
ncbi:hypothetical protein KZP23_02710 [Echinicola marina]|uniref:hypothetical protein n=1 Tax=Echinicola marina TaxID=2859768 RepID=UPI001CF6777A|nr:hypothetical protein [Echinicola marina]UCS93965.1 hypothetical protein KZP23_02710 [Echinicola marina]